MEQRIFKIRVLENLETGLLVAISDDLRGLYVHGRSDGELWERVPAAIRGILEAQGLKVREVVPVKPESSSFQEHGSRQYDARLAA